MSQYASSSANVGPAQVSALDGIRERIKQISHNIGDLHGIADRACGQIGEPDNRGAPQAVPNGMLDEIEIVLDALVTSSNSAVARLSRIA